MKISARHLTSIVREAARDVHNRFDLSDTQADIDAEDPTMLPPDAASEIDEGLDDDRPWAESGAYDDDSDASMSEQPAEPDMDEDDPRANVSYTITNVADTLKLLESIISDIERNRTAAEMLLNAEQAFAEAVDEISRVAARGT
jgi:hypothetical protein